MDQQLSGYSHATEQKHAKLSYDGIVANGSDAPLCETLHLVVGSYQVGDIVEGHS